MSTLIYLVWTFWPWAIGLVDIIFWLMTGVTIGPIPWSDIRGLVAFWWPIFLASVS